MQINSHRHELKERILDAAIQMFMHQGIRQVRMDDIARSLSISKRTLYEIYENKEELLMDAAKCMKDRHMAVIKELAKKNLNTIEWLVEGYRLQMKEFSAVNPAFFVDLAAYQSVKEYFHSEHLQRKAESRRFIDEGIKEGYFIDSLDYDVITSILDVASEYIINANLYKKFGMPKLFHNFVVVFFRGVCTQKGIELLDNLMQHVEDNNER